VTFDLACSTATQDVGVCVQNFAAWESNPLVTFNYYINVQLMIGFWHELIGFWLGSGFSRGS